MNLVGGASGVALNTFPDGYGRALKTLISVANILFYALDVSCLLLEK